MKNTLLIKLKSADVRFAFRQIPIAGEESDVQVMAHVDISGQWAYHECIDNYDGWGVTHVPTGRSITPNPLKTKAEARERAIECIAASKDLPEEDFVWREYPSKAWCDGLKANLAALGAPYVPPES